MIRAPLPEETDALVALAVATGLFQPGEADALLRRVLDDHHAGLLGEHSVCVRVEEPAASPDGWAYFAPSANAAGVWDLWWIGVAPERQGRGIGDELLRFVEAAVRASRGRLLVIETSGAAALEKTRGFYTKRAYARCGTIPDFYGVGDDKVMFAKRMT